MIRFRQIFVELYNLDDILTETLEQLYVVWRFNFIFSDIANQSAKCNLSFGYFVSSKMNGYTYGYADDLSQVGGGSNWVWYISYIRIFHITATM